MAGKRERGVIEIAEALRLKPLSNDRAHCHIDTPLNT